MSLYRHKTFCTRCRFRSDMCVCERAAAIANKLDLPLRISIIMHAKENRKTSNTGHLIRLALRNAQLHLHGFPGTRLEGHDFESNAAQTLCLFPARGGQILSPEIASHYLASGKPLHLVVPDGNWGQTTRMLKRIPHLNQIPRIELPKLVHSTKRAHLRQRRNLSPERLSTYEAIAATVGMFFGDAAEEALLELYDHAAGQMMAMRGKVQPAETNLAGFQEDQSARQMMPIQQIGNLFPEAPTL